MEGERQVIESKYDLPQELLDDQSASLLPHDADILILPDRVIASEEETIAAFRPETQELRGRLQEEGLKASLAAPPGAKKAVYEEHAADWVLPTVLFAASLPVSIAAGVLANWISDRLGSRAEETRVRYREAHLRADGGADVTEIDGPGDQVVAVLHERGGGDAEDR
jgi:hypothetical protein